MDQRRLGNSGLYVSEIALGCMSFGDTARGGHQWVMDEQAAQPYFRQAVEAGITFWDTANVYSGGSSEEITGRAVDAFAGREQIVLATKLNGKMHDGPGGQGLSRKAVMEQVDASLARLGTDYIDLYQIHRWDQRTPIEETMEALHDVVKAGKVRYIGASSMYAWQFAKAQYTADLGGWTRFISMQDQYNLIQREEEREMLPFCADQGVGVIPWSPLARGKVTRPWGSQTKRDSSDQVLNRIYHDDDKAVVDAVEQVAAARGVPMAQVALAWVLTNPVVTAPIVGATKPHHLDDAVAALGIDLSTDEVEQLTASYQPHLPAGF